MAARNDDEADSLLSSFDNIYLDFKSLAAEIQMVRSNWKEEVTKREALESVCLSIKQENERLTKLYKESLNSIGEEVASTPYQIRKLETGIGNTVRVQRLSIEEEHVKKVDLLKQDYIAKIEDLEAQLRAFLFKKATNETTINHLRQDLSAHKMHMQTLATRLDRVSFDLESKYNMEIRDLKDCLVVEQEEKNELHAKCQDMEKEFILKTKQVEQQQDLASNRLVETIKTKMMKLRKENEILRRKLASGSM